MVASTHCDPEARWHGEEAREEQPGLQGDSGTKGRAQRGGEALRIRRGGGETAAPG